MLNHYLVQKNGKTVGKVQFDPDFGTCPVDGELIEVSQKYFEEAVIYTDLDVLKENKITELKQQCEATIIGGYQSTVVLASTGKAHLYPTDRHDQLNVSGTLQGIDLDPPDTPVEFKTMDTGVFEIHTPDEFKQVAREIKNHVLSNLKRANKLGAQVMATTTKEEVDAIVW